MEDNIFKIEEIKLRWKTIPSNVCSYCMTDAINEQFCLLGVTVGSKHNSFEHPKYNDGEIYAEAGQDIHDLLGIIDTLLRLQKEQV